MRLEASQPEGEEKVVVVVVVVVVDRVAASKTFGPGVPSAAAGPLRVHGRVIHGAVHGRVVHGVAVHGRIHGLGGVEGRSLTEKIESC